MTDVLIYWRDYRENWASQLPADRPYYWHSKARLLGKLEAGDQLWMVTCGKVLEHEDEQAGFLVGIWTVRQAMENPGDDPAYPVDDYRYRVVADPEESISFAEPVPVDEILRPEGRGSREPIGRFLQGPRKLDGNKLRRLRAAAGPELALRWLTGNKT